ncbi:hypothetical protein N7520_011309 [Penicillium odoratum]|uniref:uncharacterized protein n=1 Tax=Penicillium odoratum TaxID=1167516 RepID=UPI002549684C|nr:uncharacterized protein N7520_011309 [Penicillium odoratum]KAJ5746127.1 hypothetical protein N7520_011309 [Penicillium odoratum]
MGEVKPMQDLCAIFVHAGAGYHSRDNELKHLKVCELAVEAGMSFLRHGGTAIDAVETALMVLEDAPITNAGRGSNLNEQGVVECDASIVDHFGRSGAAGAVPSVKNPIALARRIYEKACVSPGMQRVPPNLLCGQGAADFAWDNNIMVVPNDMLVSPLAAQRFRNWTADIALWEIENPRPESEVISTCLRRPLPLTIGSFPSVQSHMEAARRIGEEYNVSSQHVNAETVDQSEPKVQQESKAQSDGTPPPSTNGGSGSAGSRSTVPIPEPEKSPKSQRDREDFITDTVGAIAVDSFGNIAAGSSSGGIGMKHYGRIGPAALIGIGTHVIPIDPTDPSESTVAVVASGTGEHIASTFAASTCANRVYYSHKKAQGGLFDIVNEEEAIESMIKNEFSGHPAVVNSEIESSLGLMIVKKTTEGIALFFAHNTESFAIGSLSNRDERAQCVMSRNPNKAPVALGARMIRPSPSPRPQTQHNPKNKKKHKIRDNCFPERASLRKRHDHS